MSSVDHAMKTIGSKNDNGKRVAKSPNVKKRISKNNNLSSDFINANTGESDNGEQIEKSVGTSN